MKTSVFSGVFKLILLFIFLHISVQLVLRLSIIINVLLYMSIIYVFSSSNNKELAIYEMICDVPNAFI